MEMYRLADRDQLWHLIASVRSRSEFFVRMLVSRPDRSDTAQRDHRHILRALEAGDADAVEEAVRHHLRHTVESLAGDLESTD
jgi:DNA-binding GntR family transcriptional regulator